jgi:hypothetical protein
MIRYLKSSPETLKSSPRSSDPKVKANKNVRNGPLRNLNSDFFKFCPDQFINISQRIFDFLNQKEQAFPLWLSEALKTVNLQNNALTYTVC